MKRKAIKRLSKAQLESLHTGTLMTRRAQLLACEESLLFSDKPPEQVATLDKNIILFKDDPLWQEAYQTLKEALATRENWPPCKKEK